MKTILAIPNYNGSKNLQQILTQVIKEDFAKIYVLDDKSTDNSCEIIKQFSNVTLIKGKRNLGPAGNRNRILKQDMGDIIMFLDVDMSLETNNVKAQLIKNFSNKDTGIVGGMIMTEKNEPMWWNYGYEMHPVNDAKMEVVHEWMFDSWGDKKKIEDLKGKYNKVTPNLEISFTDPMEKQVDWVTEANFAIQSNLFKKIGGYDSSMKYHENQDLCKRIRNIEYNVIFSPTIVSTHNQIDTYGENRARIARKYAKYFYKKHYNMSEDIFTYLFPNK